MRITLGTGEKRIRLGSGPGMVWNPSGPGSGSGPGSNFISVPALFQDVVQRLVLTETSLQTLVSSDPQNLLL